MSTTIAGLAAFGLFTLILLASIAAAALIFKAIAWRRGKRRGEVTVVISADTTAYVAALKRAQGDIGRWGR